MRRIKRNLFRAAMLLGSTCAYAQWPSSASAPPQLSLAHSQYAAGDFVAAAKSVVGVMKQYRSKPIVDNAMQLADAIQAQMGCQPFPADWSLPEEIRDLRMGQIRREQEGRLVYRFSISGNAVAQDTVQQLQLRHSDGTVILDKKSNLGEWSVEPEDGGFKYVLEQPHTNAPIGSGLYFIKIETARGKNVEGYVILSNHVASKAPTILKPEVGQSGAETKPELAWLDFKSPEITECDHRSIYLTIRRKGAWDAVWEKNFWENPLPTSTEMENGEPGAIESLTPGSYLFGVRYNETHKFGPVRIRRVAQSIVSFEVTP
jgi:hypothetical protein